MNKREAEKWAELVCPHGSPVQDAFKEALYQPKGTHMEHVERSLILVGVVAVLLVVSVVAAYSQTTSYITPNYNGGYVLRNPLNPGATTYITPNYNGGYTARNPFNPSGTTFFTPNYNGGYTARCPLCDN